MEEKKYTGSWWLLLVIWDTNSKVQKFMTCRFGYKDVPNTWPLMVALLDGFRPCFISRWVRWNPLIEGWWKVNTNGASKGNSGLSAAVFCIRHSNGNLVVARGSKLPDTTNLVAEVVAIREALQYSWEKGYNNIIVETNLLALVHMLNGVWNIPWSVALEVNSINRLILSVTMNLQISRRFMVKF
ncbi:hypothetical protein KY285_010766 [Solanum tuberosum]|nr:hypothetical protein KY289_011340 [Solanum tuberosum]KAH0735059.1 hypothetical protein KY285_010766 [Solanum tuberosum]